MDTPNALVRTTSGMDYSKSTYYAPATVNVSQFPEYIRDQCIGFLDLLHRKRITLKAESCGWTPLKTDYLRNQFGRHALADVLSVLRTLGVLECDRRYRKGKRSRRYRVVPWDGPWVPVQAAAPKRSAKRQTIPLAPVHYYLQRQLGELTIDLPQAVQLASTLEPNEDSVLDRDEYRKTIIDLCQVVHDGDFRLTPDQYGRVHSLFTRLPRKLRGCLRLCGEPLVGIDLANAQPLLAGVLCVRYHASRSVRFGILNKRFRGGRYSDEMLAQLERVYGLPSPQTSIPLGTYIHPSIVLEKRDSGFFLAGPSPWLSPSRLPVPPQSEPDGLPHDLRSYLEVCQRGEFYESLGDDRKAVKKELMVILFDRPGRRSEITYRFNELYPTMAQFLRDLKTKNSLPAADRYKYPSHLLQNFEATLFIGRICRRLMNERADIPVLTLHDSLYTTDHYVADLLGVMRGEFARIGLEPTFKLEPTHAFARSSRAAGHCHVADGGRPSVRSDVGRVPDAGTSIC